jgi:hypothetical protein
MLCVARRRARTKSWSMSACAMPAGLRRDRQGQDLPFADENEIEDEAERVTFPGIFNQMAADPGHGQELGNRLLVPAIFGKAQSVQSRERGEVGDLDRPQASRHGGCDRGRGWVVSGARR